MHPLQTWFGESANGLLWWQLCLRGVVVFGFGLSLLRIGGKRLRGRWGAVDLVLFVVIGSNLSRAVTGNAPLVGTLIVTAMLVALHGLLTAAAVRWPRLGPILKGRARRVVIAGQIDEAAMRRQLVGRGDLDEAIRLAGLRAIEDVDEVWIERNGRISVVARDAAR